MVFHDYSFSTELVRSYEHSVSFSNIKEKYLIDSSGIELIEVVFEDQGGAGMPDGKQIVENDDAYIVTESMKIGKQLNILGDKSQSIYLDNRRVDLEGMDDGLIVVKSKWTNVLMVVVNSLKEWLNES